MSSYFKKILRRSPYFSTFFLFISFLLFFHLCLQKKLWKKNLSHSFCFTIYRVFTKIVYPLHTMYTIYNTERKHNIEKWDDARERDFLAKQVKPVNKMEWMRSHLHALFSSFFFYQNRQTDISKRRNRSSTR